jgi:hypothetical protein
VMNGILFTPEYVAGVNSFVDFISARYSSTELIYCPCNLCCNQYHIPQHLVRQHLIINDIASKSVDKS